MKIRLPNTLKDNDAAHEFMRKYNPSNDPNVYEGTFSEDQIIKIDGGRSFYIEGEWIPVYDATHRIIAHPHSFQAMLVVGKWLVPLEPLVDKQALED
jgi:hypothetical protein